MLSRKRGRLSNHQLAPGLADRAIALIRERDPDFGPTLACEKLAERHGLVLGVETIRALMTAAGLWTPRKQRAAKIHQPRNRRACVGELIQIDGSDHAWFEHRLGMGAAWQGRELVASGFGLRPSFGFRPSAFGFSRWMPFQPAGYFGLRPSDLAGGFRCNRLLAP